MRRISLGLKFLAVIGALVVFYYQLKPALDNQRETNKVIAAEKAEHDQIFEEEAKWKRLRREAVAHTVRAELGTSTGKSGGGSF
jgi:hypothetical protein